MSLPAEFIQIDLFSIPEKQESKKARHRKTKETIYHCDKCGKSVVMNIPAIVIICGCGRKMKQEEFD
ncbi:hypothetical protein H1164_18015 [Thermoactinomyces daqus]|uniref:Uncharacterized protein n=1 Tax=Thermoactinomyces daqus TaxID=1329516 RepID=A0A7W2AIX5_9BACL|nr:hypothetical protein [Thermoactinomyces daqus]MBA4544707.1 hypothetical protein [Thermoactinomyces daqus]